MLRRILLKPNFIKNSFFSTKANDEYSENALTVNEEAALKREQQIERSRNKSSLRARHYSISHGILPKVTRPQHLYLTNQRKLFGIYGFESGFDARLCWPTEDELSFQKEKEDLIEFHSLQEAMEIVKQKRKDEQEAMHAREEMIEKKLAKFDQWSEELKRKINAKQNIANEAKAKKEKLIEEVRRHFGLRMNPKDDRFKTLLAEKEKEQKKAEKLAKRAAKEAQYLKKLQEQNAEIS